MTVAPIPALPDSAAVPYLPPEPLRETTRVLAWAESSAAPAAWSVAPWAIAVIALFSKLLIEKLPPMSAWLLAPPCWVLVIWERE